MVRKASSLPTSAALHSAGRPRMRGGVPRRFFGHCGGTMGTFSLDMLWFNRLGCADISSWSRRRHHFHWKWLDVKIEHLW